MSKARKKFWEVQFKTKENQWCYWDESYTRADALVRAARCCKIYDTVRIVLYDAVRITPVLGEKA